MKQHIGSETADQTPEKIASAAVAEMPAKVSLRTGLRAGRTHRPIVFRPDYDHG